MDDWGADARDEVLFDYAGLVDATGEALDRIDELSERVGHLCHRLLDATHRLELVTL
jgi:hypothetical protein